MTQSDEDLAIGAALDAVRRDPAAKHAWGHLFEQLLIAGRVEPAMALLGNRQENFGDALSFAYDQMGRLAITGRGPALTPLLDRIGADHLLLPVALFARAILAAAAEDAEQTGPLFQAAVAAVLRVKAIAERDREFVTRCYAHMVNQALQVEAPAYLAGLGDDDPGPLLRHDPRPIPMADFVVLAACDGGYFTRFAPLLAESVAAVEGERAILHINVVNPGDDAEAMIADLQARHPRLRVSRQDGQVVGRPSAYYACNRFLVAPALLDRYRRPLVIVDIDVTLRRDLAGLLPHLARCDVGLFEWANPIPSIRCFCMLSVAADTVEARRFLTVMGRYAKRKLAQGALWMTDQASLWSVSRALGIGLHGPRWGDLTQLTGASYESFVVSNEENVDKMALRRHNDRPDALSQS
jgi:hypothetical protein